MEWLGELVGGILEIFFEPKQKTDTMPDGEELSDCFTVRQAWRETIFLFLLSVGILCGALFGLVLPRRELTLGICFSVLGLVLLVSSLLYGSVWYKVDRCTIVRKFLFCRKTVYWRDVTCAKILEKSGEKDVILALYSGERLVMDICSPMKNFWKIVKLAESRGLTVQREAYVSIRKMKHL